jgi:hypothetical protein
MPYVTVQVPEQDLIAVYELLLARADREQTGGRQPDAPAKVVAVSPGDDDAVRQQSVARLYASVTDEGRAALKALAESPGERNFDFEAFGAAADVPNLGAALQSIAIQSKRDPEAPRLVEKRRHRDGYRYSMDPRTAAIIRDLAGEDA